MASTSFDGGWQWPEDLNRRFNPVDESHGNNAPGPVPAPEPSIPKPEQQPGQEEQQQQQQQRRYHRPRQCRICLEVVQPSFNTPLESLPGVFQPTPSVTYESPDGGRLLRPCQCRGSQKYVHEGCLNAWRLADPSQRRNYWHCPTCRYNYRLERMTWASWIGSKSMHSLI